MQVEIGTEMKKGDSNHFYILLKRKDRPHLFRHHTHTLICAILSIHTLTLDRLDQDRLDFSSTEKYNRTQCYLIFIHIHNFDSDN